MYDILIQQMRDEVTRLGAQELRTAEDVDAWDSINHVKLLIGLEADLGFRFETDEVSGLHDVGELVDLVQKKLS